VGEPKRREQLISLGGVVILALILPGVLKLANSIARYVVERPLGPLPTVWRGLAQGGDNLKGFLDGITDKIAGLEPEYIRIDHIYDQFGVVEKGAGGLTFNWAELDKVVKKIQETKALPFFSLSYMPPAIASKDILSEPRDWNEWATVVQKTIEHYSGEMGLENVYYEVWNEPDLFGKWKMGGSKDYRTLYLYAALGAKRASGVKPFKIGGPATTGLYRNWVDNFFPYILKNQIRMDFFSWHRYDLDINRYAEDVRSVDRWIEAHPYFARVEKIVSEMGPRSEMGGENETGVGAAHVVATARELMYKARMGMNFAVSGNWGVVGRPRFGALALLSRLGDQRLSVSGEGTWVKAVGAKDGNKYQVLIVNYDSRQAHNEVVPVSFINLGQQTFTLRTEFLNGGVVTTEIASAGAVLQTNIPMPANSIALVELEPKPAK